MRTSLGRLLFLLLLSLEMKASVATQEDWGSPKLDRKQLTALKPLTAERGNFPTFTRELVRVQWRQADPIYLYILLPKLVRNPPVVLYLYNYERDSDRFLNEEFGALLTENGVAAVGFSSALSAQRYHDRPMKQWFVSELQESLGSTAHDVQMIVDYLATRTDIDVSRVGMFGEGSGAAIAVLGASADPRIKVLDLLDPWGDWPEWVHQSNVIPEEERASMDTRPFLDRVASLDPVRFLPELKIPIRIEYLADKGATPAAVRQKIEAVAPPQTLIVSTEKALAEYKATSGKLFLNWIKDLLLAMPEGH